MKTNGFVKQTVRIHFRTVSLLRLVMGFTPKNINKFQPTQAINRLKYTGNLTSKIGGIS